MEIATRNLIQAIEKQRETFQMSDRKFSKGVLGVSPAYWCLLKAGQRRLTPNLAVLFMHQLPGITPEVQAFIMHQGKDGDKEE